MKSLVNASLRRKKLSKQRINQKDKLKTKNKETLRNSLKFRGLDSVVVTSRRSACAPAVTIGSISGIVYTKQLTNDGWCTTKAVLYRLAHRTGNALPISSSIPYLLFHL